VVLQEGEVEDALKESWAVFGSADGWRNNRTVFIDTRWNAKGGLKWEKSPVKRPAWADEIKGQSRNCRLRRVDMIGNGEKKNDVRKRGERKYQPGTPEGGAGTECLGHGVLLGSEHVRSESS